MQINSINSVNFGTGTYFADMAREDIEEMEKINQAFRKYNNFNIDKANAASEPKRKGIIASAASILLGAAVVFAATKRGFKSITSIVSSIGKKLSGNEKAQQLSKTLANKFNDITNKNDITKTIVSKASSAKDFIVNGALGKFVKKAGAENVVSGAVALGTTARVLKEDGNNNGIPDIMEKGVNAYKNVLNEADMLKEVVDTFS